MVAVKVLKMNPVFVFLLVILAIVLVVLTIVISLRVVNKKYKRFVLAHSMAIKNLARINKHYNFNNIKNYDMKHSYDNADFYEIISTKDYLIYQLVYIQKNVYKAMNDAYGNKIMFEKYVQDIKEKCTFNVFDAEVLPKNKNRLTKIEKELFEKAIKTPQTGFSICVTLVQRKINDRYVCSKSKTYGDKEIRSLIGRVNNKRGDYYCDREIWDAICRVERGKVSNKMRFAIYERDGYCCCMCGRYYEQGLEIDHIIPIAKGGKSTCDNLQTLCRSCNKKKGTEILPPGTNYSRW